MKTDAEIKIEGTRVLLDALGELQAERYITLIRREPFDYTQWQKNMWSERTIKDISSTAMKQRNELKE